MGRWGARANRIFDDKGEFVGTARAGDIARQIAREHNTHEGLIALVKQLRKGTDFMKHDYDEFGSFPQENPWNRLFDHINAVLAQAEGRGG